MRPLMTDVKLKSLSNLTGNGDDSWQTIFEVISIITELNNVPEFI
jgi:hypothetical protein